MSIPSSEELKMPMIKDVIQQFLKKCIKYNISRDEIMTCFSDVYSTELLLNKKLYEWALEEIAAIPDPSSNGSPQASEKEIESVKPLFCEDTVYHASLCCYAVGTKDLANYKKFFSDFKHQFEELSLSRSCDDVDRYIIARKGKTYFVAFLSEPTFSGWAKYKSFEHG
jgi:hypothetical protein